MPSPRRTRATSPPRTWRTAPVWPPGSPSWSARTPARWTALAAGARDAWQREYVRDGRLTVDTQATHVRALALDLVPADLRRALADRLVELVAEAGGHLATGFLATPDLLPVLADAGHLDTAYEVLLADGEPGWMAMVDAGSTTVWERWDGVGADGTPHESLNHYSKGAVISFLHRVTAGIAPLEPAYRRFRVAPRPGGGLTWATAAHECPYGRIESAWTLAHGRFELRVVVPAGTSADVVLPDGTEIEVTNWLASVPVVARSMSPAR